MSVDLQTRAAEAVELGKSAGAEHVWAGADRGRSVDFSVRDGKLEKVQEATSQSLYLKLWVDGRFSSHTTSDLRPDRLKAFVAEAVALTRALEPDPFRLIPDPALFEGRSEVDLDVVDAGQAAITREQRIAWCQEMNERVRSTPKLISCTSSTSDGRSESAAASSNGFTGTHASTSVWMGTELTLQDEGDRRPEAWMWAGGAHLADGLDRAAIADEAIRRGIVRLGSTKGPTKKTTMVVDPTAAGRLVGALLAPANGGAVQQGRSFWKDRLGEKLVSDKLVIVDDPLLVRGLASRKFDGEGIAAKQMEVIRGGALQNLYVDTYYGKKLGIAPTTGGPSNRIVAPGARDLAAIVADLDDAIYVTSWLGGNSDAATGDFSFGLRGHAVTKGQIGAPIGEMNVTGNLLELFARLAEVGSDPWRWSSTRVPTLVFEGVQFSGV